MNTNRPHGNRFLDPLHYIGWCIDGYFLTDANTLLLYTFFVLYHINCFRWLFKEINFIGMILQIEFETVAIFSWPLLHDVAWWETYKLDREFVSEYMILILMIWKEIVVNWIVKMQNIKNNFSFLCVTLLINIRLL